MQYSVQLPGMPGGLRRAFLSARSLSAPDDVGNGLPLLRGGPRHGQSLAGNPDVAVVHLEVDLAGSRQDQWGRSRSVFPIRNWAMTLPFPVVFICTVACKPFVQKRQKLAKSRFNSALLVIKVCGILGIGDNSQSLVLVPRTFNA